MGNNKHYDGLFPYEEPRDCQVEAIDYALEQFSSGKKIVIIEAGTGVGKSAIGLTIARKLNNTLSKLEQFESGAYFLTTQKILQEQYVQDFACSGGKMTSIKSASNYQCSFNKKSNCAESLQALRVAEKGTPFWKKCTFDCNYRNAKKNFLESPEGVTNFPYFLAETQYSGKIKPRNVLVIDEAHNAAVELSKFVEITMTERFAKSMLKLEMPPLNTQSQAANWVKDVYSPKLNSYVKHMESMLEKYTGLKDKLKEFVTVARQYDLLDKHMGQVNRFLEVYDKENWVFNLTPPDGRKGRKLEFKPIDVAPYAEEMLFSMGRKIIMMSATILNVSAACELLGIDESKVGFVSIPSPFPVENRPVITASIGKMSSKEIENTLPKLAEAVKAILQQHKGEKGIIHCHTFKIANYLKRNIRDKRLLTHNSDDREDVLKKHMRSKTDSVILSPSMTEGVDLHGDNSRFQIICKVPYPYLGDKLIRKRMNKWEWWYPLQTAKTIVQAVGRSVRSDEDHAVTYILDSDWSYFYNRNKQFFPDGFRKAIK
jgi:ATP-dependent DNA helicase DinG